MKRKQLVYHQNLRGLRTTLKELSMNASESTYNMIILTASWLWDVILNRELGLCERAINRNDRSSSTSEKKESRSIQLSHKNVEHIFVLATLNNGKSLYMRIVSLLIWCYLTFIIISYVSRVQPSIYKLG